MARVKKNPVKYTGTRTYSGSPEAYLISAVLRTNDHITAAARGITVDQFHAYDDEWRFIESYITKHRRTPSKSAFYDSFPHFRIKKVDDVDYYCDEVRFAHTRADFLKSFNHSMDEIERGNLDKAISIMHEASLDAGSNLSGHGDDADSFKHWESTFAEVERRFNKAQDSGFAGIPTGFETFDYFTGGLQPGQFVTVAARLGQGKTSALVKMAVNAAFSGESSQFFSLEQPKAEIDMRAHIYAASHYGRSDFRGMDLARGINFSLADYKKFLRELSTNVNGNFHVFDGRRGAVGAMTIAAQIERNRPDIAFIDYLTLMDIGQQEGWQGYAKLSAALKRMAGQYQVPIVIAAQLNREAANSKKPAGPENIAESDAIGRDSDIVISMIQVSQNVVEMKLVKNRHGRSGIRWYCHFDPNVGKFEEVTYDEAKKIMANENDDDDEVEAMAMRNRVRRTRVTREIPESPEVRNYGKKKQPMKTLKYKTHRPPARPKVTGNGHHKRKKLVLKKKPAKQEKITLAMLTGMA